MGPYPWTQDRHAQLVNLLSQNGAKTIGFDVLFLEPDVNNPDDDEFLAAEAAKTTAQVFGMLFNKTRKGAPPSRSSRFRRWAGKRQFWFPSNVYPELSGLVQKPRSGWITKTRSCRLSLATVASYEGKHPESLAKELRAVTENRWHEAHINYTGWNARWIGRSRPRSPTASFVDVLRGRVEAAAFKDKIVIVGGTLHALFDLKPTVISSVFPGLEIQATRSTTSLKTISSAGWTPLAVVDHAAHRGAVGLRHGPGARLGGGDRGDPCPSWATRF